MKHSLLISRNVVGVIGNVISVFLFASPTPTFIQIYKKKSVEQYKPDPYLATTMNCMLWVFYGMPFVHPKSLLVVTTNGIGLALEIIFLLVFFIYADKHNRLKVLRWIAVELTLMAIVIIITMLCFHTTQKRTFFVGILCVIFCLGMYVSPLTIMWDKLDRDIGSITDKSLGSNHHMTNYFGQGKVFKTKSVEYMPFWLSVGNFANGVIWTIYAFLPLDQWILIPNGLGAISGAAQLILYACYYKTTKQANDDKKPNQVIQMSSHDNLSA